MMNLFVQGIYEGLELGIFKRVARGVYKVESQLERRNLLAF